jgi:hypothetical protein
MAPVKIAAPRYIDVPEVGEVFVDRLRFLTFDGHQLRLEFDVLRADATNAGGDDARQWAYTACRLVMSANGVGDLLDQMARLGEALRKDAKTGAEPTVGTGTPQPSN